jgi:hypothetical protein
MKLANCKWLIISVFSLLSVGPKSLMLNQADAFCGFYVAKADTQLFNQASKVVLVRSDDRTVLTMVNDFKGDPKEFAMVIPVPEVLQKEQIHVGDKAIVDHLDAYSSPRLVEYFDEDPCDQVMYKTRKTDMKAMMGSSGPDSITAPGGAFGVKIEAQYTVGEYDILILSAEESSGLESWLKQNEYRIPEGAGKVLESYIKQKLKFFVAKVNLKEQSKLGFIYLRPLQVAYESPKFMLPIRLGTVNANGPQELFVFALTPKGRVETTNYRTVKLPTGQDIPVYIREKFADFYKALFGDQVKKENMKAVFLEYAWNMNWCDPCAADPLTPKELKNLGVFWLDADNNSGAGVTPNTRIKRRPVFAPPGGATNVFITRLHVRYDRDHFPEDLMFQETSDQENFQGRYVLRHPWKGNENKCEAAKSYFTNLKQRQETEAQNLARLTGWEINDIRKSVGIKAEKPIEKKKWYQNLWEESKSN